MNIWQRVLDAPRALARRILARIAQPGEARIYVGSRQAGVNVTEDTALTFSAVWACVRVIAETTAALPWHVYQQAAPNDRKRLDRHGVHWLLNVQANPECSAYSLREAMLAHACTWGNGYAEIERGIDGRPIWLWLITPDRVTPGRRQDTGALFYRVTDDTGGQRDIEPANMLHLHGLGFDGLVGYSPVRMAARSIGLGIAQDTFGAAFYENGTTFGGIVEVPAARMTAGQIEELEGYLNEKHAGPANAFRVRVVANGSKYHGMSMPMTDAQFLESRRYSATDIARWYRVPPHKIADLDRSTNNNIEHQSIEFVTDTIMPWVVRLEQEVNLKLFGARAQATVYSRIALNALMRGDSKSRAEFYRTMTTIGAMTINEVRALEDLNGIGPDGDQHLVQLNQTTLESLVERPPKAGSASTPPAPAGTPKDEDEDGEDVPGSPESGQNPAEDSPGNVIRRGGLAFWQQQGRQA